MEDGFGTDPESTRDPTREPEVAENALSNFVRPYAVLQMSAHRDLQSAIAERLLCLQTEVALLPLSATFTLKSAPGKGTTVSVDVPLKKGHVYE